ncbi:VLRF1 family aeRF1-type release factor [Aquibacillus saliphilus]|uniref:VLRF1 family aeRF1-type release factor n=1 Tax=Aquibacillus saliphilus TaxID=1909422 RepID=UPI001CEFF8AF|nr:VLRF1 family aeRF1-type release factor [Aquibacillus saliphilus]
MKLEKKLKDLQSVQLNKPNRVLTMYLNTDPSDPDQQGGEWKIQLKNGLNSFENYLEESGDKEELKYFKNVRTKVEDFVYENKLDLQKSIVLFASPDESVWFAEKLQMNVKTEFHWQDSPVTDQLYQMHTNFPKTGIILVQQSQVKIIEAELGAVLETKHYQLDLDTEDWRQFAGPDKAGATMGKGGKNLQQDHFDNRFRANQKRWYKNLAPNLDKLAKDHQWERIYIVGEKEEARDIEQHMNKDVYEIQGMNILDREESKVIEKVVA